MRLTIPNNKIIEVKNHIIIKKITRVYGNHREEK